MSVPSQPTQSQKDTRMRFAATAGELDNVKKLIEEGADLNSKNFEGKTALMLAIERNHFEVIKFLLEKNANIEITNKNQETALHVAARHNNVEVAKLLIGKGANLQATNIHGQTPLMLASISTIDSIRIIRGVTESMKKNQDAHLRLAASAGDVETVKQLIKEGADLESTNSQKKTALILAAESGQLEVVKSLIDAGANIEAVDQNRETPLMFAAQYGHLEVVKLLIEKKASLRAVDKHGKTALMQTINPAIIEVLKKSGATLRDVDYLNRTVFDNRLIMAASRGRIDVIASALAKGAKLNTLSTKKKSALLLAAEANQDQVIVYLQNKGADLQDALRLAIKLGDPKGIKTLVKHKVNLEAIDASGDTPLITAVRLGQRDVVRSLLQYGADREAKDSQGKTALMVAREKGLTDIVAELETYSILDEQLLSAASKGLLDEVERLINKGANPESVDRFGRTAVMLAAKQGQHEVLEYLIKMDVDLFVEDIDGNTAFSLAEKNRQKKDFEKTLQILQEASEVDTSQDVLLEKLLAYFKIQINKKSKDKNQTYRYDDTESLFEALSIGHCSGLAALWLYRSSEDNLSKFWNDMSLICEWDETAEGLAKYDVIENEDFLSNKVFEPFLNEIRWSHATTESNEGMKQWELEDIFNTFESEKYWVRTEDSNGGISWKYRVTDEQGKTLLLNPGDLFKDPFTNEFIQVPKYSSGFTLEFKMAFLFKKDELIDTIKKVIPENKMTRIGSPKHSIAVRKMGGKYHVYDGNSRRKLVQFSSAEAVEAYFEYSFFRNFGYSCNSMPVHIDIYHSRNQTPSEYPFTSEALITSYLSQNSSERIFSYDEDETNPLAFSAYRNDENAIKAVIKMNPKIDVNKIDSFGKMPLYHAIVNKNAEMVRILLNAGANLTQPLRELARDSHHKEIIDLLEIEQRTLDTKLLDAASKGRIEDLNALISRGANLEIRDALGRTPLLCAAQNGHAQIIKILIFQANFEATDLKNKSAFSLASQNNHTETAKVLESIMTPILLGAITEGDSTKLENLLKAGFPTEGGDKAGNTALMLAAEQGKKKMVNILIKYTQNYDKQDSLGKTALMKALERGHSEIASLLQDHINKEANLKKTREISDKIKDILKNLGEEMRSYITKHDEEAQKKQQTSETQLFQARASPGYLTARKLNTEIKELLEQDILTPVTLIQLIENHEPNEKDARNLLSPDKKIYELLEAAKKSLTEIVSPAITDKKLEKPR